MALRDSLPPAWLLAATVLAGLAAGVLWGRSGSPSAPSGPTGDKPAAAPAPSLPEAPGPEGPALPSTPGFPPPEIAKAFGEVLPAAFGEDPGDPALREAREKAWARVKDLVAQWAAGSRQPPLANAAWWRAALRSVLPSGAGQPRGLFDTTVRWIGRDLPVTLSVPQGPGPFPAVLALLDGAAPREAIPALYGPGLRTHLVVGVPWDPSVADDPRAALLVLAEVARRYPVDPDLVVLDGTGRGAAPAAALADDAVRQVAGIVLRGPPEPAARAENLGLLAVLTTLPDGSCAEGLASVPPRASADPRRPVAWASATGERFRSWGPGFVVKRCIDPTPGKAVRVRISRDPARNAVVLETGNVAEILLLLSDEGLDLGRPVKVVAGGMVIEEAQVPRSLDAVRAWATRGDPGTFVSAELTVRIPE
jgi:hypothetical protein